MKKVFLFSLFIISLLIVFININCGKFFSQQANALELKDVITSKEVVISKNEPVVEPEPTPECITTNDCMNGQACVNNICRYCSVGLSSCGSGYSCCFNQATANGYCYLGNCCQDSDCLGGRQCVNNSCSD